MEMKRMNKLRPAIIIMTCAMLVLSVVVGSKWYEENYGKYSIRELSKRHPGYDTIVNGHLYTYWGDVVATYGGHVTHGYTHDIEQCPTCRGELYDEIDNPEGNIDEEEYE